MKKVLNVLVSFLILVSFSTSIYAESAAFDEHGHDEMIEEFQFEGEITVEVKNNEGALNYARDPKYKYTFIFEESSPSLTRAICYMCGRASMSTVTYKEQSGKWLKPCPYMSLKGDYLDKWDFKTYERCTSCGSSLKLKQWDLSHIL